MYLQIFHTPGTHVQPLTELADNEEEMCESSSESSSDKESE